MVVSCDVTGEITLGTNLKMLIFIISKISVTKGWSDQEVNTQIDKDPNL